MRSFGCEIGPWQKRGYEDGLFPIARIGWFTFWWCGGSLTRRIVGWTNALDDAESELRRLREELARLRDDETKD